MNTLRIVYGVDGWAYHSRALALQKYAPDDFNVTIVKLGRDRDVQGAIGETAVDILFVLPQLGVPGLKEELRRRKWGTKVVRSSNQGWPYWLSVFYDTYCDSDLVIVNNREYWEKTGRLTGTVPISNGVDLETFCVKVPLENRRTKVLWVGSSKGRIRRDYDELLVPLQNELQTIGIPCEFLMVDSLGDEKLTREQMADWYNSGTVFVCASRAEGTPNPCLEAAACGCTVVSTAVGNMPELLAHGVNGYLVSRDLGSLVDGIQMACDNYLCLAKQMQHDIRKWDWAERSAGFFQSFRDLLNTERPPTSVQSLDISGSVTVFVSTVGAASFKACLKCLAQQDCTFPLKVIEHVAPMSRAFQRMLDDCGTPYFVQVDEDMLLFPHAIRTLYETIRDSPNCLYIANLYDVHLERCIQGVKIFRHDIVREYPFEDVESCEKSQVRRLRADGHVVQAASLEKSPSALCIVLGLHGTYWTAKTIFERYMTLERKRRTNPAEMEFFREYHGIFLERFLDQPSKLNFFALMGVVCASMKPEEESAGEKDYRRYERLSGLPSTEKLWREISLAAPEPVSEIFVESTPPSRMPSRPSKSVAQDRTGL